MAVLAALACALAGCGEDSHALTQATVTVAPPSGTCASPVSLGVGKPLTLTIAVTNAEAANGQVWPATFVELDPGSDLKLTSIVTQGKQVPQQVDSHRYAFGPLKPGKTKTVLAVLTATKAGGGHVNVAAWGGSDPADVPSQHGVAGHPGMAAGPPSASCSITVA